MTATTSANADALTVTVTANNLPGNIYAALIEKGTAGSLDMGNATALPAFAQPFPTVVDGKAGFSLVAPKDKLDRNKQYEVIVWKIHSNPAADTIYATTEAKVTSSQWDLMFPAAPKPTLAATVKSADEAGLTLSVSLDNVTIPTGKWGAYVGVIEKDRVAEYGTDAGAGMVEAYFKTADFVDGALTREITVPKEKKDKNGVVVRTLDPSKQYVAVSWLAHGYLSDDVKLDQKDLAVSDAQWNAVFPKPGVNIDVQSKLTKSELTVNVNATGLPGKIYAALIERGTADSLDMADSASLPAFALPFPTVTDGTASFSLVAAKDKLDRNKQYEVLIWKIHSAPEGENVYGSSNVNISAADWDIMFPSTSAIETTSSVVDGKLNVDVTASGLPGKIYAALIERGTADKLDMSDAAALPAFALPFPEVTDGKSTFTLQAPKDKLDRNKQYEVLIWKIHSAPEGANVYGTSNVTISTAQWKELFPYTAALTTKSSVASAGLQVEVNVTGAPGPIYAALIEAGTAEKLNMEDASAIPAFATPFPTVTDGKAKFTLTAPKDKLDRKKQYEVLIWKIHSNPNADTIYGQRAVTVTNAQWDELAGIKPPVVVPPKPKPGAGSLTWGISTAFANYTTGGIAKGQISTSGVGGGRGGYVFPQASGGSWNADTRTGSVQFAGSVTFTGHGGLMRETFANPVITVSSPTSGTISAGGYTFPMNLIGAGFSANSDGSVTWSGVSVGGSISGGDGGGAGGTLGMDSLSFTVGSASGANFGSTSVTSPFAEKRTAAKQAPTNTGLTVVTPAKKLVAGGEIEITAGGFQPNEQGILVVIYSEPTVLDTNAKADANGVVRWIGSLPKDLVGEHTITLQGSINVGQTITIEKASADKNKKGTVAAVNSPAAEATTAVAEVAAGTPAWVWWTAALALLVVAGGATGLVVAQRRRNAEPTHL